MTQHPNTQALIKLAYSYAMYDYQNYAKRHNKNNPVYKRINVQKEEIDHDQVHTVKEKANKNTYVPKVPVNKNAPDWSKEQTHVYRRQPSVNGTGGGPAYGPEHRNPFAKP